MPGLTALCPPAGEFLSLLYLPVTHIHILCVVELFQDPVVPAALFVYSLPLPVAGMEAAHDESVIGMRLADTVKLPHGLGHAAVCHMDREPCLFLQFFYDLPPYSVHERGTCHGPYLRLPSPQGTILLMVRRYVALCCTKRREVRHPVRVVALPVTDVMHGEGPFRAPAKQASVPVPVEDCVPQGVQPAAGPRLVVRPFRGRPARLYRLKELRIESPGLRCDADYGTDLQVLHYYADMQVLLMLHRRGKPPLRLFPPVVKTGLSVTEPVPPCPAVTPSVVMALLLIRKGVVLGMHEFMLFRLL